MRHLLIAGSVILGLATATAPAHAIGCFSGAVAGAVAGHLAHHAVLGAIGGCIAGHHWHKQQMRRQDLQDRQAYVQERQKQDPNYRDPWSE
jgi:outer membrane lipoprotein SlyB